MLYMPEESRQAIEEIIAAVKEAANELPSDLPSSEEELSEVWSKFERLMATGDALGFALIPYIKCSEDCECLICRPDLYCFECGERLTEHELHENLSKEKGN